MQRIDTVYEALKERIFQADYSHNQVITEREICQTYGVSKVTAGEALHRLCHEGHLTAYPRTGYMVTALTPEDMLRVKRIRLALENLVVEILCTEGTDAQIRSLYDYIVDTEQTKDNPSRLNRAFHGQMARLTGDPFLISTLDNLLGAASRVEQYVAPDKQKTWQDYHRAIVDAILSRNLPLALEKLSLDLNQR